MSLTHSAACSCLSVPSAGPGAGFRNVGTGQNSQAQRAVLFLNDLSPASACFLILSASWKTYLGYQTPEHSPPYQGKKQVTSTGSWRKGQNEVWSPRGLGSQAWLCDFGHAHFSLSLSFLMCRMGAILIIYTPSVDVQNGKSMVQP